MSSVLTGRRSSSDYLWGCGQGQCGGRVTLRHRSQEERVGLHRGDGESSVNFRKHPSLRSPMIIPWKNLVFITLTHVTFWSMETVGQFSW